jgi:hypothetical protein
MANDQSCEILRVTIKKPDEPAPSSSSTSLPATIETILDRFPGTEIIRVTRYDLPDWLVPLDMAGQPGLCAQCRDPDGMAVRWLDRRRFATVWLHPECRRHWPGPRCERCGHSGTVDRSVIAGSGGPNCCEPGRS